MLARPATALAPVPACQFAILVAMGIAVVEEPSEGGDLILDGLVGYSPSGAPMGRVADLITWANGSGTPILALDVPPTLYSGMACPILTPSFAGEDILRIT